VADGHDIFELQANLVALGLAPSALRVDNSFDSVTAIAVRRWQASLGIPQTGIVRPGDAIYVSGPIRVTAVQPQIGMFAQPGQTLMQATSTQRIVLVELNVALEPLVKLGDAVAVALPDGTSSAAATVSAISTVAVAAPSGGQNGPQPSATVTVTITFTDPAATGMLDLAPVTVGITNEVHKGVLAVPVMALLAQPDGKFGVEVVEGGSRHVVIVTTGLYDDRGLVEVTSAELHEGMLVEVPAT
jgi:peptidoglycan hydrolase-like protein with peptidoglycan-binding domain